MTFQELLSRYRSSILAIADRYGARSVRVFGSVSRGDADERSDLDLLVSLDPGRSLFDLAGLHLELEALLCRKVDVTTEGALKPRMKEQILREARPI